MRVGKLRGVLGLLALIALTALVLAACGGGSSSSGGGSSEGGGSETAPSEESEGSGSGETINLLTWEGYHEPEWLEEFEQETGIKVNATNVGSPAEMFSKVKASPEQYDLILNTSGWFPQYVADELLEPIDKSKVTALKNIKLGFPWEEVDSVEGTLYGVLYNWGDQPLAWVPKAIEGLNLKKYENSKGELDNWNVLWDPQLKGKVSIFDDPTSVEPMVPLALGFENPYQLDEEEFEAFENKLFELEPQVKRLTTGFDDQTAALASGEASVAYLNIIAIQSTLHKEGKELEVNHLVKGGVPAWSDNYAITKAGGGNKLAAIYKFINYTEEPAWQARFIGSTANSGTLNYEQATSPEAKQQGLTPEKLEETLIPATKLGDAFWKEMKFFQPVEDLERRLNVWNEFKLGLGG
ncbi:MAG: extracellular solute-binding protein [Solirubrobacterales bacterium]